MKSNCIGMPRSVILSQNHEIILRTCYNATNLSKRLLRLKYIKQQLCWLPEDAQHTSKFIIR